MTSTDRYQALADLPFDGGYPTAESHAALDDELFFQRATQVYLWALPAMNSLVAALHRPHVDADGQEYPSLNGMNDLDIDDDGSFTLYVGPEPTEGVKNWLKTVPGRGWFSLYRFYGPTQEFFDNQYRPGNFVKVTR